MSKMCANYLAVWKIRVNTHNRHARQYTDYFLNTNTLRRVRFLEYLSFPRYYPNLYMPPSPIGGRVSSYPSAVFAGAWSNYARKHRRYAFLLTRNNKPYQI